MNKQVPSPRSGHSSSIPSTSSVESTAVDLALDEFMAPVVSTAAAKASPVVEPVVKVPVAPPAVSPSLAAAVPSRSEAEPPLPTHLELGFTFIRVPLSCFDVANPDKVFRNSDIAKNHMKKFQRLRSEGFTVNSILQPNPEEYVFFFVKSA